MAIDVRFVKCSGERCRTKTGFLSDRMEMAETGKQRRDGDQDAMFCVPDSGREFEGGIGGGDA